MSEAVSQFMKQQGTIANPVRGVPPSVITLASGTRITHLLSCFRV